MRHRKPRPVAALEFFAADLSCEYLDWTMIGTPSLVQLVVDLELDQEDAENIEHCAATDPDVWALYGCGDAREILIAKALARSGKL